MYEVDFMINLFTVVVILSSILEVIEYSVDKGQNKTYPKADVDNGKYLS